MTSRRFFYVSLSSLVAFIAVNVVAHISINTFGLFGNAEGKSILIYYNERLEKDVLSYNYIPANFHAVLIGPSTSSNINTKNISSIKLYNLSINGGNISELKELLFNYLEKRTPRLIVIGMYPYLVKDHGMKTSYISSTNKRNALGSIDLFKRYLFAFVQTRRGVPSYNNYGYFHYLLPQRKQIHEIIKDGINLIDKKLDVFALCDLNDLLTVTRKRKVKVLLYFHPIPNAIYTHNKLFFSYFKNTIEQMLPDDTITVDFNSENFTFFTSDYSNYQDGAHLSDKGASLIEKELDSTIKKNIK